MCPSPSIAIPLPEHGKLELPSVRVDGYSLQLRAGDAYLGDTVSRQAFAGMLDAWRELLRDMDGKDPMGRKPTTAVHTDAIDDALTERSAAGTAIRAAVEDYAQQLAHVVQRFMRHQSWTQVQRIVIGGGFSDSVHGQRAVQRASELLNEKMHVAELCTLHHHPDEGGLIGWVHAIPPEVLQHHEALLAVDIGGTNLRCGIVRTNATAAADMSKAEVLVSDKWEHGHDDDVTRREHLVRGVAEMLEKLVVHAQETRIGLAPFVGVACPGLIRSDGSIRSGAQNLPGDWESDHFHFPSQLARRLAVEGQEPLVCLHNDAVVQGLSQRPWMQDVKAWAVLTVGTGLGNASFTNRRTRPQKPKPKA